MKQPRLLTLAFVLALSSCGTSTVATGSPPPATTGTPVAATATSEPTTDPIPAPSPRNPCDVGDFGPLPVGATCWADPDSDPSTPLAARYTIPAEGWLAWPTKFPENPNTADPHIGISITEITNLTVDACQDQLAADPPVGPSVEDLATALASLPPFEVMSPPTEVAIYGYTGTHLELTVPELPWRAYGGLGIFEGCDGGVLRSWIAPGLSFAFYGYRPGQVEEFWILDVEGTRLVVEANWSPDVPPEWVDEMRAILDSIRIEP